MSFSPEKDEKVQRYINIGVGVFIGGTLLWIFALQPLLEKANLADYPAQGSISEVTYNKSKKQLGMKSTNVELDDLVDTSLFEPLKPGDDPNKAEALLGEPDRIREEGNEDSQNRHIYREYDFANYILILGTHWYRYSDGSDDLFHTLESIPSGLSYYQVLKGDSLSNIPSEIEKELKTIGVDVDGDNYGSIELNLLGDRVEYMRWYENRPER